MQNQSIRSYVTDCSEQGKNPKQTETLDAYNKSRGWHSKYIGKRVQLNPNGSITLV